MKYRDSAQQVDRYRKEIVALREKIRAAQSAAEPEEVSDYEFQGPSGPVRLSALFGDRDDLFVIHNMGKSCSSCTMWADGFNGIYDHIASRAAFVVISPDPPEVQQSFAADRGWRFPMVSHAGTSFAADMGYRSASGGWMPGISAFRRDGKRILRIADTGFNPTDDFCTVWRFFDLLPEGSEGWRPKLRYD